MRAVKSNIDSHVEGLFIIITWNNLMGWRESKETYECQWPTSKGWIER